MPRLTIQQNDFSGGEISPRLHARTDVPKRGTGLKKGVNGYAVVHGGWKRRGGSRYFKAAKFAAQRNRLIPFVYSRDAAYMLEFGNNYLRVFKAGGVDLAVELVTPYTEAMLNDIDFAQGADTMFLFHPSVPIQRLRRFSDSYFDLSAAPFVATPFDEQGHALAANLTLSASTVGAGRTVTASAGVFLNSDVGRSLLCSAGLATVTGYTSATSITVTIIIAFPSTALASGTWSLDISPQSTMTPSAVGPVGATITLTASAPVDAWRAVDVGKFVEIDGGLVQITSFTSSTVVNAVVRKVMNAAAAAPPLSWSLESDVWTAANGYPRTGTLHQQRLVVGGSTKYPQTVWGSKPAEYLDFTGGTADDDSFTFTIAADEINPISYLTSIQELVAHTYGGEFSLKGGVEKPITPTNVRITPESPHGSLGVRPLLVGRESLFVQRAGRKLRSMGYNAETDGFRSPDLTVLAEHITAPGTITSMTFQQEPDMLIWATRSDGAVLTCTFDRDQQVAGWDPHYTEGAVESIASIPNGNTEEVWWTVRRTVNGSTVRYVEILNDDFQPLLPSAPDPLAFPPAADPIVYGYTVDSGLAFDNVAGQTTFAVPHLIGCTVDIVADGSVMPSQVVPGSGNVTITRPSFRTLIGLHFESEMGLLTPEVGTGTGTAQGNSMRTSEVTVSLLNTLGCAVYDGDGRLVQDLSFKQFGPDVLNQAPMPFTGLKRAEKLGWERGRDELSIVQRLPLPLHVRAVIRKYQVND